MKIFLHEINWRNISLAWFSFVQFQIYLPLPPNFCHRKWSEITRIGQFGPSLCTGLRYWHHKKWLKIVKNGQKLAKYKPKNTENGWNRPVWSITPYWIEILTSIFNCLIPAITTKHQKVQEITQNSYKLLEMGWKSANLIRIDISDIRDWYLAKKRLFC